MTEKTGREHLRQIKEGIARKCNVCGWMMFKKNRGPFDPVFECEMCDNTVKGVL